MISHRGHSKAERSTGRAGSPRRATLLLLAGVARCSSPARIAERIPPRVRVAASVLFTIVQAPTAYLATPRSGYADRFGDHDPAFVARTASAGQSAGVDNFAGVSGGRS